MSQIAQFLTTTSESMKIRKNRFNDLLLEKYGSGNVMYRGVREEGTMITLYYIANPDPKGVGNLHVGSWVKGRGSIHDFSDVC